jgi:glycosyltransferase involved in cell wall biosynthesis
VSLISAQAVARHDFNVPEHEGSGMERQPGAQGERRILMVAPQPFYQDRGTPIAVRQVLEALTQLGYRVDLLTYPVGTDIQLRGLEIVRTRNPFRIKTVPVGFSLQKALLDLPLAFGIRARLRTGAYTCIHAVEEAAFPAVVLGRHYNVPVIYDMQSSLPEQLVTLRGFRAAPVRSVLDRLERWLLQHASVVVCSAGLAERVHAIVPQTDAREWHYPSVVVPAGGPGPELLRDQLSIPLDVPVILYGGTFESYQGLSQLIESVPLVRAQAPGAVFLLVGAENGRGSAVRSQAMHLIQAGAVKIIDRQPRHVIPSYLRMADVLVSPRSHGGNLPLKVFDYLAAGRPIVATDIPTHRTVLNGERALLVAPDSGALAGGILGLLRDPVRAARLAHAARRYAEEHLGWSRFVESVHDLYEDVHAHVAVPA